MDVDKMEAGPEIDALVAVQVMGWTRQPDHVDGLIVHPMYRTLEGANTSYPPAYSKNIAHAWDVAESARTWALLEISMATQCECTISGRGRIWRAAGDTAPLAICRAALKAVGA